MKELNRLFFIFVTALALGACGGSGDGFPWDSDGGTTGGNNVNRNEPSYVAESQRIEIPHLVGGNTKFLVTKNNDAYGVNYCVEWDVDKKSQRWTAYTLTKKNKEKNTTRYYGNPQYPFDPKLSKSEYLDDDYFYGSGFDHGHICPSNDRLYSYTGNYQTFFLTNMQPQYSVFNGSSSAYKYKGLWINMEQFVSSIPLNKSTDVLYVCKGGTIRDDQVLMMIKDKLIVPKYFFAAILLKNDQGYRALGFWFPHSSKYLGDEPLSKYAVTIDELERNTGIDFFCNLPDNIENSVESKIVLNAWGLK